MSLQNKHKSSKDESRHEETLGTSLNMVPEAILKVSKLSPHNRMEYKRHLSTSPQNIEIHKGK